MLLWHIPISHFSEKVRWALDWKGLQHERRAPGPPMHMAIALALTRGQQKTFPVLKINGRSIGDSTDIIAALERYQPEPPLYPADAGEHSHALELEEWFDEALGPHMRLLAWHEITRDTERLEQVARASVPDSMQRAGPVVAAGVRTFVNLRFGAHDEEAAELARTRVVEALDKLEAELGSNDYLVGGRFSVADLTAAALFYPLVLPPEGPQQLDSPPEAFERFRAPLAERRGYRWVGEMFKRHRRRAS